MLVKAHKDLIGKALDSSTEEKLALNMIEVIFLSEELAIKGIFNLSLSVTSFLILHASFKIDLLKKHSLIEPILKKVSNIN